MTLSEKKKTLRNNLHTRRLRKQEKQLTLCYSKGDNPDRCRHKLYIKFQV